MIQINDSVRITRLDKLNLQVETLETVVNPETKQERQEWKWQGYYGTLRSAFVGVLNHATMKLVDEDIKGVREIIARLDQIKEQIKGVVLDNGNI